jgi:hypothetical protein
MNITGVIQAWHITSMHCILNSHGCCHGSTRMSLIFSTEGHIEVITEWCVYKWEGIARLIPRTLQLIDAEKQITLGERIDSCTAVA